MGSEVVMHEEKREENRIEWIDIAKGFAIILVIAGHTIGLRYSYPIYSFHMPLFFFLSGFVYSLDKFKSFKSFVQAKTNQLLRPYVIIYLISLFVTLLIPQFRENLSLWHIMADFYTTNSNNINNSSIWFLISFFIIMVYFYGLNNIVKSVSDNRRVVVQLGTLVLIALFTLCLPYLMSLTPLPIGRMPFKMDSALIGLVFFALAAWYKDWLMKFIHKLTNWQIIILSILLLLGSVLNGRTNLNAMTFGRVELLYYPIAIVGILFVLAFFCKIDKVNNRFISLSKQILNFYGKNSLVIFGFQSLYIRIYLMIFNNIENLDMQLYMTNPIRHQIGSFLIVTFVCSPLTVYLFKYLRKKHIKLL